MATTSSTPKAPAIISTAATASTGWCSTISTAGVTVDLAAGTGSGGFAQGDAILNFENLEGSNFDDI